VAARHLGHEGRGVDLDALDVVRVGIGLDRTRRPRAVRGQPDRRLVVGLQDRGLAPSSAAWLVSVMRSSISIALTAEPVYSSAR
jgi:hypothetical protein